MSGPLRTTHGGTDSGAPVDHDFSTNANPLGPPPALRLALQQADRGRYPDPQYRALRERLGRAHKVEPERIVPAAGGSEAIRRLTLAASLQGLRAVWVPQPGFGDYALAAEALGLSVHRYADPSEITGPALVWICAPNNPTGESHELFARQDCIVAVDLAYEPLRLVGGAPTVPPSCWQLHCPNKALGLTGVRAAYLVAPALDGIWARMLSLAASWVLSAEGQVMLMHWSDDDTKDWLSASRAQLRPWTAQQRAMLDLWDWEQRGSTTPFWLARPPAPILGELRERFRIKLRDAGSFGLPGEVRIATLPPSSQQALQAALKAIHG